MHRCTRCDGFVPADVNACPNCNGSRAWWAAPLAFASAGFAMVTLSACYGSPCALTIITLPDGGQTVATDECGQRYDCATPTLPSHIRAICDGTDGGVDGGTGPGADGGLTDADAGP